MSDQLLEMFGLEDKSYTDLTQEEQSTYQEWLKVLEQTGGVTTDQLKSYVTNMKNSVIEELAKTDLDNRKDQQLKARLTNYTLLESFLSTPDKAKKALEAQSRRSKLFTR